MSTNCPGRHDKPRPGQPHLCTPCQHHLRKHIAALPPLLERLAERLQPTGRGGPKVTTGKNEAGINLDPRIVQLREHIHVTLTDWSRIVAEERNTTRPHPNPHDMARFLLRHHDWLTTSPYATEYADNVNEEYHRAHWLIVPPKARQYGGRCHHTTDDGTRCTGQVLVDPERDTATCTACGTTTNAATHWCQAFALVDDNWLGTATEIQQLLALRDGVWVNPNTLRSWVHRRRLTPHGDRHGNPLYRVGDLLELHLTTARQAS